MTPRSTRRHLIALIPSLALTACSVAPPPEAPATTVSVEPVTAVRPPNEANPLDEASLMTTISFLAGQDFHGRGATTAYEARAAAYLAAQLKDAGLSPISSSFTQPFTHDEAMSANVWGSIAPAAPPLDDRFIVLGAHYDHLGVKDGLTYPGADDNASGVAVVLGVARALAEKRTSLRRHVVVVFFGAEEVGLVGSRAFVDGGPFLHEHLFAMVNVDMVGRRMMDQPGFVLAQRMLGIDPDASVAVDGIETRPALRDIVERACEAEDHHAVTIGDLPEIAQGTARRLSQGRGDNWSFERRGIPSIFFSSGESSDYHTPNDTTATIVPSLVATRARIVERTVIALASLETLSAR